MPTKTEYLTTVEAAHHLNLSHRTLEKMRIQGDGPIFRKFGRRVLYKRDDLEEWAENRKRHSTSDFCRPLGSQQEAS